MRGTEWSYGCSHCSTTVHRGSALLSMRMWRHASLHGGDSELFGLANPFSLLEMGGLGGLCVGKSAILIHCSTAPWFLWLATAQLFSSMQTERHAALHGPVSVHSGSGSHQRAPAWNSVESWFRAALHRISCGSQRLSSRVHAHVEAFILVWTCVCMTRRATECGVIVHGGSAQNFVWIAEVQFPCACGCGGTHPCLDGCLHDTTCDRVRS